MKLLKEVLDLSIPFLEKKGIERSRFIAESLLAHLLKMQRIELYMYFDRPMEEEELSSFREALKRVSSREPYEYVLGEIPFYGCDIEVGPEVLIPRQETELLLDQICDLELEGRALDLCTGSGCLAIGLKKRFPSLDVVGVDLAESALERAKRNALKNGVEVDFRLGDLLEPVKGERFDLVICNPPYISETEYEELDPSVKEFEPKSALVSGKSGYEFFERLASDLPSVMAPGAHIFFEIGSAQKEGVLSLFQGGNFSDQQVKKDFAGHDRFFSLKMKDFSPIMR